MSYEVIETEPFKQELKAIFKKFPKAEKSIREQIKDISSNPHQGDIIPGFGDLELRKIRLGIKEYKISKSKGLRLIWLVKGNKVVLLRIYHKADYRGEQKELNRTKEILREILKELSANKEIQRLDKK